MIHVNIHEPEEIITYLQNHAETQVSNFTPGDYLIGHIALERKTTSDFLQSLFQKRLMEQLGRLKQCYPSSFLLLETFDLAYFQNSALLYSTILKIMLELNVRVIFTSTKEQSAQVILLLAGKQRQESTSAGVIIQKRKEVNLQFYPPLLLEKVPGVGRKRAQALLQRFATLRDVFQASEQELADVEGIGKKTASAIKSVWSQNCTRR
ncbi:MAG: ERCC4 domain-containing protein [Nanoarchaeota archaeon]